MAIRKRFVLWPGPVPQIQLRWLCHVIAWREATETWRGIAGE